jgi:hypothetical protein
VKFAEFEREARRAYEEIPPEYREGIDGLAVLPDALPHPTLGGIYTLGMCLTESYPSGWSGPETTRSTVALYHGSFEKLARQDPGFDWEGELWETLTHELRHHLESLANEDQLEAVDYALDETFKRGDGLDFDPWYYQSGDEVSEGIFRVEYDFYIEAEWTPERDFRDGRVPFRWHGQGWSIPLPEDPADVHFIWIDGIDVGPGTLQLVLVRRRPFLDNLRAVFKKEPPEVAESEAVAEPEEGWTEGSTP